MKTNILKPAAICLIVILLLILSLAGCGDINLEPESDYGSEVTMSDESVSLHFRNDKLLNDHFKKHGIDMGFSTAEEYEKAASRVVNDPDALHKTESDDGDDVYYLKDSNEFVVVSTDGYLRTYFLPDSGISYFNRQ